MDSITIQVGPHYSQHSKLIKCDQQVFNIGRAFTNDLVLQDQYVSANQIRLRKKQSGWQIDILDKTNPIFINGKPVKQSQAEISSGDWLSVGRTVLRFIGEDQEIEPTRKMLFSSWYHLSPWKMLLLLGILVITTFLFVMFLEYLQEYNELKWQDLISSALMMLIVISVWAAIWAIIGRALRHQNQFFIQFLVTLFVFLLGSLVEIFLSPISYLVNSQTIGFILEWGISFIILGVLLYFNYSIATNLQNPLRVALIVSGLILIVTYGIHELDKDSFQEYPDYMEELYPPMINLQNEKSIDEFMDQYDDIFLDIETE